VLPLPFATIRLALRGPFPTPRDAASRAGRERFRARLESELLALAEAGERPRDAEAGAAVRRPAPTRSESG
jgi:hypothetical protein